MLKLEYAIHALHGFMGQPLDWSRFSFSKGCTFYPYQLLTDFPIVPLTEWAELFNQKIGLKTFDNILLGYSLGGRLALHAVINKPQIWKAVILLSTHPGLKMEEERKARLAADQQWARRFEKDSWEQLMNDWNAQDVFKTDTPTERKEMNYDRQSLSNALNIWSLGRQADLRLQIASLKIPILWIVGENDRKYLSLGHELTFRHPQSKLCVVSESGHRLQSSKLENFILNFMQNLGETKQ